MKEAASPGVKGTREQLDADGPLESAKWTPYRAVVARANYLTNLALAALKMLGSYVVGHLLLIFRYPWQTVSRIDAYSHTDWSRCPKTRKSSSAGCLICATPSFNWFSSGYS